MEDLKIVGIEVRTSNQNGQALEDLEKLWRRFFSESISAKINAKVSENIFAVYTDYESDYTCFYTTIIGCEVEDFNNIPEGLVAREFPAQKFVTFTAKGELHKAVGETWTHIWEKDKELNRSYIYDYELYGKKAQDPADAEIEIFIGVKN